MFHLEPTPFSLNKKNYIPVPSFSFLLPFSFANSDLFCRSGANSFRVKYGIDFKNYLSRETFLALNQIPLGICYPGNILPPRFSKKNMLILYSFHEYRLIIPPLVLVLLRFNK